MEEQEILLERWYTTPYGDFMIHKTRFGLFRTVDREGNGLVTGGTAKAVFEMTPCHLMWEKEGYTPPEGVEVTTYSGTVGGKL